MKTSFTPTASFCFFSLLLCVLSISSGAIFAATPGTATIETYLSKIDDTDQPYSVYLPTGFDPAIKHPCVIYLHGYSGRVSTSISAGQKSWADSKQWILVTADGRGSVNYDHAGEKDVLNIRDALITRFSGDAKRIYLQGFSMGGHGTYRLALRFPDLFAAANPGAGWTDFNQFLPQYYEQASLPKLPSYLDPTRAPLLKHTAALPQVENGLPVAFRIYYRTGDTVNPPINATQMIDAWNVLSHPNIQVISEAGGHSFEPLENAYPFFEGKTVNLDPENIVYNTTRLRHDGAFWAHIRGFTAREQPARIKVDYFPSENRIAVNTQNVERFALSPSSTLLPTGTVTQVTVNAQTVFNEAWTGTTIFRIKRDSDQFAVGWLAGTPPVSVGVIEKAKGVEGPMDEATLGPFTVVYGASGSAQQTADNLKNAQLFCGQWNGMMILRWGFERPVPDGWWVQPYPFASGSFINPAQAIVPVSDAAAAGMDLSQRNLILFGDPSCNALIEQMRAATQLPIQMDPSGTSVTVAGRTYSGPNIRWTFVHPRPDAPNRLAMVSKGFLSSLPEIDWAAFDLSKDFEQWPWLLPDYVIWDTNRLASGIVNEGSTYRYLPERYLEAGFFTSTWKIDNAAPNVRATFTGLQDPASSDTYLGPGLLILEATDGRGQSGIAQTTYRVDGGPWIPYSAPVFLQSIGTTSIEYQTTDRGLSYLYEADPNSGNIRATETLSNTSAIGQMVVTITGSQIGPNTIQVRALRARLQKPDAKRSPGDNVRLTVALGDALVPEILDGIPLSFTLGASTFGPFTLDAKGRFSAEVETQGLAKGKIKVKRDSKQLRIKLKNIDLEKAFGIPADATSSVRNSTLFLTINNIPVSTPLTYKLIRKTPSKAGRIKGE